MFHCYLHRILEFSLFSIVNVESTLELDYERVNIPMGPSSPCFELIYLVGMGYERRIDFRFTFVHKGVLVIM